MTRTHYVTASSLDDFIATQDHSLEGLLSQENDPHGPAPLLPRRLDLELLETVRNGAFVCVRYAVTR